METPPAYNYTTDPNNEIVQFLINPTVEKMKEMKATSLTIALKDDKALFSVVPNCQTESLEGFKDRMRIAHQHAKMLELLKAALVETYQADYYTDWVRKVRALVAEVEGK